MTGSKRLDKVERIFRIAEDLSGAELGRANQALQQAEERLATLITMQSEYDTAFHDALGGRVAALGGWLTFMDSLANAKEIQVSEVARLQTLRDKALERFQEAAKKRRGIAELTTLRARVRNQAAKRRERRS